jgi:broad specificity phosphatase PhoE
MSTSSAGQDGNASTVLTLVRHGETDWNAADRIQGQLDTSRLTKEGRRQAFSLATILRGLHHPFLRVCCSPLTRALDTLSILQEAGAVAGDGCTDISVVPDLLEMDFEWRGWTKADASRRSDFQRFTANPELYVGEGGFNPLHELRTRVNRVLNSIEAAPLDEVPDLLVGHKQFNSQFILRVLTTAPELGAISQNNCAWSMFERTEGRLVLNKLDGLREGDLSETVVALPRPDGALVVLLPLGSSPDLPRKVLKGISCRADDVTVISAGRTSEVSSALSGWSSRIYQRVEAQTAEVALAEVRRLSSNRRGGPLVCLGDPEYLTAVLTSLLNGRDGACHVRVNGLTALSVDGKTEQWCLELLNAG